jgi:hypothetical protein
MPSKQYISSTESEEQLSPSNLSDLLKPPELMKTSWAISVAMADCSDRRILIFDEFCEN